MGEEYIIMKTFRLLGSDTALTSLILSSPFNSLFKRCLE